MQEVAANTGLTWNKIPTSSKSVDHDLAQLNKTVERQDLKRKGVVRSAT